MPICVARWNHGLRTTPKSRAGWARRTPPGDTDLPLDDFVNSLDAETGAAGEKAAKPWLDALNKPNG
jgi:hypothetical protein